MLAPLLPIKKSVRYSLRSMPSQPSSNILVIESDPEGRSFLRSTLSASEYLLAETITATAGLKQIEACAPTRFFSILNCLTWMVWM